MKRYIRANTTLKNGSYLLNRDGKLEPTVLHVPSTTYVSRELLHLCPTDANFLVDKGKITEDEAITILEYCLVEFLTDEKGHDSNYKASILDISEFRNYADLKYAPMFKTAISYLNGYKNELDPEVEKEFKQLNNKWYKWLQNNFVKVTVMNNVVEFRISSTDGYDWNDVIIDDIILRYEKGGNSTTKYTIAKETADGYKVYFLHATLNEILENDNQVLSSRRYKHRRLIQGTIQYE